MEFQEYLVDKIFQVTSDIFSFRVIPVRGNIFSYIPGQFAGVINPSQDNLPQSGILRQDIRSMDEISFQRKSRKKALFSWTVWKVYFHSKLQEDGIRSGGGGNFTFYINTPFFEREKKETKHNVDLC
ncbi:MAG: hypothetical protein UT63_C0011G0020 [Candidatus Gottesmanbacteria bacterium GW2011_GWC2_39_8]|uniref:Uncharacterized protein n=1 Tax=Candidatus Gottesmanbacteria bacterium GW2011_GWC2_39_8 TaxID=1618450 RepID=A0A0G0Q122_9BACT|nr:MAG: hypothetical protein UT63_C0011G0020 [Candidatus Gottesmanbacteria bacterium GW2011_GWC2_39_8]